MYFSDLNQFNFTLNYMLYLTLVCLYKELKLTINSLTILVFIFIKEHYIF